jgi:predicted GH43/DUF377 family glycosyl hydrolase
MSVSGTIDVQPVARDEFGRPLVRRVGLTPIVGDGSVSGYGAIFNAGLLFHCGVYHLFARAVRTGYRINNKPGPRFVNYVSDVVVFESVDAVNFSFAYVLAHAGDDGVDCFEDPRVQRVTHDGSELVVMTYTDLPPLESGMPHRIGSHILRWDGVRFHLSGGRSQPLGPLGVPNKDAVIFNLSDGRVALIHRIHPNIQLAVFDDVEHLWSAGTVYWDQYLATLDDHVILRPALGTLGIGAGAPPVTTEDGLLLFFHERRGDGTYTMNLALLDPATGAMRRRLRTPLLVPELDWERYGDVNNVVFVQGCHDAGDDVYLTYGAADSCVGAAYATISGCLSALRLAGETTQPVKGE